MYHLPEDVMRRLKRRQSSFRLATSLGADCAFHYHVSACVANGNRNR
jgi:hypothetical protein